MRTVGRWGAALAMATCAAFGFVEPAGAAATRAVPIVCNHGPADQTYQAIPQAPATVVAGAAFTIRVDGVDSGEISQTGLRYLHDITYDFVIPQGAKLVPGSLQIVAGTGTPNVREGARVVARANIVTVTLPGKVTSGERYTPPSFELRLEATAAPGTALVWSFARLGLTAAAIIVGDVVTSCDPKTKPHPLTTTKVVEPPAPVPTPEP